MMNLWSVLKNGNAINKSAIGITKNWLPPQAEIENTVKIPAPISFANTTFLFWEVIPLNRKYTAKRAKNNPRGSDLNHPIGPRISIGNEIENNRAENRPAVVPPMTLTIAKRTIADKEPKTTGNSIVKS